MLLFSSLASTPLLLLLLALGLLVLLKWRWTLPVLFLFAGLAWANWSFSQHWQHQLPADLEGQSLALIGRVVGLPASTAEQTRFTFLLTSAQLLSSSAVEPAVLPGSLVNLVCYRCPFEIMPASEWQFTARLKRPHGYASWGAFDYEQYLFRHQVVARGYLRLNEANRLLAANDSSVDSMRWRIRQSLAPFLDDSQVGVAMIAALMIGDKSWLSHSQQSALQASGVSHLIAISGLHVGLVFLACCFLLKWLLMPVAQIFQWQPRQLLVLLPALGVAFGYAALAGFSVSTQRAIIMLSVFVLCRFIARDITLLRVLLIAASLLLLYDPFSIMDGGFWLSFLAVLIIALSTQQFGALSLIRLQPLLWAGMLPLSLLLFGQVSLIAPLVNLLLVPLFCFVLIPMVLVCLLCWQIGWSSALVFLIKLLSPCFEWLLAGLQALAALPYALVYPSASSGLKVTLFALVSTICLIVWRIQPRVSIVLGLLAILALPVIGVNKAELSIALLDVGQGLALVIEADDYVVVYDTGPAYRSGFSAANAVVLPYLRSRGISAIDRLIISHADNDHIGGLLDLQQNFPIAEIITSDAADISGAAECVAGQVWQHNSVRFEIIAPRSDKYFGKRNNNSCVLLVSNGHFRILIPGDIEYQAENDLLKANRDLSANILVVPHHGSKTSSGQRFLDRVKPQIALLSAGYRNRYKHPHKDVVSRYNTSSIELITTVQHGSVLLEISGNKVSRTSFRQSHHKLWNR